MSPHRAGPGREPVRHLPGDPRVPSHADPFQGSNRQQFVAAGPRPPSAGPRLLGLQGGRVQHDPVAAGPAGGPWRAGARRPDRPDGHRHDPGLGIPKASPESVARAIFNAVEHGEARREVLHNHGYAALMAGRWPGGEAKTSLQPAASDMYSPPTFLPFSRSIKADGVDQLSGRKLRTVHDDGKWTSVTGEGHETVDSTDRTLQMSPVISSSWRMSFLSPSRSPR